MRTISVAAAASALLLQHVSCAETATGVDLKLPATAFGTAIEGCGVNSQGDVLAVDFRAGGESAAFAYGSITDPKSAFFVAANNTAKPPYLAGSRTLRDGRVLLTDAANKRVLAVGARNAEATVFCTDPLMLQPNDLALSTLKETTIYLSGQNYTADTTAGVSGDLWTCNGNQAVQFPTTILATAGIHRTNGIETSPDGKSLYLSSAKNVASAVVQNTIFKFALDATTGVILTQAPTVFHDFVDTAATDIDGMRCDTDGNLYVTRNGLGQVVKLSPTGELLLTITLPGMGGPSSVEFGGPKGSTLYAVGRCAGESKAGCAASYETTSVGKAFAALQRKVKPGCKAPRRK